MSLQFVHNDAVNNKTALVQIMAWRWIGAEPLSDPIMIDLAHWRTYDSLDEYKVCGDRIIN